MMSPFNPKCINTSLLCSHEQSFVLRECMSMLNTNNLNTSTQERLHMHQMENKTDK